MSRYHTFMEPFVFSLFLCVFAAECVENQERGNWIDLQNQFVELSNRVQELESRDKAQQEEINSLKNEVHIYKKRTTELERALSILETNEPDILETNEQDGSGENKEDAAKVGHAMDNMVSQVIKGRKNGNRIRQVLNEGPVAFFAALDKHADHTGVGQNIVFDKVITNIGSAYKSSLGVFIAPMPGTYVFSASMMALASQSEHYWFAKNGQVISRMYVHSAVSPFGTSSVTAVLQLNAGDNVEIKTADAEGSAYGDSHSTFAGFLLQLGDSAPIVGK